MIRYLTAVQSSTSLRCDWLSRKALERCWKKVILDIFFFFFFSQRKCLSKIPGREKRENAKRKRKPRNREFVLGLWRRCHYGSIHLCGNLADLLFFDLAAKFGQRECETRLSFFPFMLHFLIYKYIFFIRYL